MTTIPRREARRCSAGPHGTTPVVTDDDAAADTSVLASVRDLSVDFQRGGRCVHALRGVSLEVRSGEILALVGESGSGKSVLGLSLLGLVRGEPAPRTTGVVEVCGVDMLGAEESARRAVRREHLGAVFQDPMTSLNPTMRVGRQVEEAAGSTAEALRMLELVGVPGAASRMSAFPHELSGGLRQRVMIAMAFAGEPRLVIADEPTTALDVTVQAQVLELMSTLRDETGCSVVMITHDVGVASQISDRTAVLYGGRLAELGRTSDVLGRPSHPYTRGLLGARIGLDQDRHRPVVALAGEPPDPAEPPRGCPFAPRCVAVEPACESQLPDPRPAPSHSGSTACLRAPEEWPPEPSSELPALQDADLASAPPVLSVNGVSKTYTIRKGVFGRRTLHALSDVVLSVRSGETVAIVGESGSGKSTLLRVAASLESADEGRVEQYGDVGPQMIFQDAGASLTPWMTVGELVGERLGRTRRSDRSARVREALARVGLPDEVAGVKAMSLSGGQRQRVAFARATIVAPRVLLCDEPTSALDASLAAVVLNLLRRMRDELSMGVVFVTHDLAAARFVADRIAVMYLGKIVEIGDAEEIVGSPMHPYTRSLLRAVPRSGAPPARLKGEPASPLDVPSGCAFHPRCVDRLDHCGDRVPSLLSPDGSSTKLVSCWLHRNPPEADGHEM